MINVGDRVQHRTPGFVGQVLSTFECGKQHWLWVLWDGDKRPKSCKASDIKVIIQ